MRKPLLTLVPLLFLVSCDQEPAAPTLQAVQPTPAFAAASDWTEEVLDLPAGDIRFHAPCVNDWFDEVGPVLNRHHTVTTINGSLVYIKVRQLDGFHIVGDKTGIWNPALPDQEGTYTERIPAGATAYSFHYSLIPYIFVSEESGTKMNWPLLLKVTINANGQVTVNLDFECKILGKQQI